MINPHGGRFVEPSEARAGLCASRLDQTGKHRLAHPDGVGQWLKWGDTVEEVGFEVIAAQVRMVGAAAQIGAIGAGISMASLRSFWASVCGSKARFVALADSAWGEAALES